MHDKISHLTHRSITDHLAICRNDVNAIADDVCSAMGLSKAGAKQVRDLVRQAVRHTLGHCQTVADLRRENESNG